MSSKGPTKRTLKTPAQSGKRPSVARKPTVRKINQKPTRKTQSATRAASTQSIKRRGASVRTNTEAAKSKSASSQRFNRTTRTENLRKKHAHHTTAQDLGRQTMAEGVWTKPSPKSSGRQKSGSSSKRASHGPRLSVGSVIGNGLKGLVGTLLTFLARHRIVQVLSALILIVAIVVGADTVANYGKIYGGVTIGEVNVSGMTVEQATQALENQYRDRVNNNVTVFYADEEALQNATEEDYSENLQEQISYEESLATRRQWTTTPAELGGAFGSEDLARQALEIGRSDGGIFKRIECLVTGVHKEPVLTFNDSEIDDLAHSITSSLGTFRENSTIEIQDGIAHAIEGHDGNEVTDEWLVQKLNETIFAESNHNDVIVELQYMPLQITLEQAQETADIINNSTSLGVHFTYEGQSWDASQADVAHVVSTEVVQESDNTYTLKPYFDDDKAKSALIPKLPSAISTDDLHVSFTKDENGTITLTSNATGKIPEITQTVESMNESFFVSTPRTEAPSVEISSTDLPEQLSVDDALSYGIITEINSFTTEYAEGVEARNFNIHLMADRLSNSIIPANGGSWSFLDTSGPITEDNGYQNAGAIIAGEYSDAIGGGVCQVATTVFNSVYEAGYPVTQRRNHSLYIASYPEGRDAAIVDSDPRIDLQWENDTSSDILLRMSYTDSSVTCTLYGVDPGYQVSTEVGEWQEGETYSTHYVTDDTLSPGDEVIEQYGADGRSITVIRTVTNADGEVLHQDTFSSNYAAKDKIIARGPSE